MVLAEGRPADKEADAIQPGPLHMAVAKWGVTALGGFQQVPDLLFRNQKRLQLTATELVVLLNIMLHWWEPADRPYPQIHTIARRMGLSPRTVLRAIAKMESLGLVRRFPSISAQTSTKKFDLTGLVERLETYAENDPIVIKRRGASQHPKAA